MKFSSLLKTSFAIAATALATAPAFAQSANWTGAYIGAEFGGANFKAIAPGITLNNNDVIGGIIAGYDYDLGTFVVGAGADVDFADNALSAAPTRPLERVWRLKLRGGVKIGNGLAYATGGYTNAHIGGVGNEGGYFIGGGYEHQITQKFTIGGEVLFHDYGNFNSTGTSVEVTSYQIRGTLRF